jgi:acyl-coenzyme A synthetase/AMP-(fatty) acid ligase
MNFVTDVLRALPGDRPALVSISAEGERLEWSRDECDRRSAAMSAALAAAGVPRGGVVMTMIGARPEWVWTMTACMRSGLVALAASEQLRAGDLELRYRQVLPSAIVADERNRAAVEASSPPCPVIWIPDDSIWELEGPEPVALDPLEPGFVMFTSGTTGEPKAVVHAQRYVAGQELQATRWLDARPGDLVWCTAAPGWSKSARNVFMAPWVGGATAMIHDARFDPAERIELLERESVNVLCMAPTEYRVLVKRSDPRPVKGLRSAVAAGEALGPEVLGAFHEATGLWIRDGYGQTETGHTVAHLAGTTPPPGAMGKPMPGVRMRVDDGELCLDPLSDPTFFLGYVGEGVSHDGAGTWEVDDRQEGGEWRSGDRVHEDEEGYLYFEARDDDVIISAGYRIGPVEVESALMGHEAVAEVAAVGAPDEERGQVVRAVVVLRDGYEPSDALAAELQEHAKAVTAPYKYPRIVEFTDELPKTTTGKLRRASLRGG